MQLAYIDLSFHYRSCVGTANFTFPSTAQACLCSSACVQLNVKSSISIGLHRLSKQTGRGMNTYSHELIHTLTPTPTHTDRDNETLVIADDAVNRDVNAFSSRFKCDASNLSALDQGYQWKCFSELHCGQVATCNLVCRECSGRPATVGTFVEANANEKLPRCQAATARCRKKKENEQKFAIWICVSGDTCSVLCADLHRSWSIANLSSSRAQMVPCHSAAAD